MSKHMLREWMDIIAESQLQVGHKYSYDSYDKLYAELENNSEYVANVQPSDVTNFGEDAVAFYTIDSVNHQAPDHTADNPTDYEGYTDVEYHIDYILTYGSENASTGELPVIVFSGDNLPDEFDRAHEQIADDAHENAADASDYDDNSDAEYDRMRDERDDRDRGFFR